MFHLLSLPDDILVLVALEAIGYGGFRGWCKPARACKRLYTLELQLVDNPYEFTENNPLPSTETARPRISGDSNFHTVCDSLHTETRMLSDDMCLVSELWHAHCSISLGQSVLETK